ncbi:MAG: cobalt transporter [Oscillospiraceae bacterium]|nr:cobalt transporter [Oscillospiraceae bacterium]
MHEHEHTHTYTHSHPHEHEEGHEHEHTHTHEHDHEHAHDHGDIPPAERTKALLAYMIDHNEHHASELAELVDGLEGEARKRLLEAIGSFEVANVQLREVLELVKEV